MPVTETEGDRYARLGHSPLGGNDLGPCHDFAPDALGDDPNVCTTCFYHVKDHPAMTAPVTVAYHSEYGGAARPAVCVKLHVAGGDFWPDAFAALPDGQRDGLLTPDAYVSAAYDRVQSDFWQAAERVAQENGFAEIGQEGRSGGWLAIHSDPEDTDDDHQRHLWLAGYAALSAWVESELAAIPARVARLAQGMAMDAAGEEPARRMFGKGMVPA